MEANEAINESQDYALRFEDLTVDDDLPLLDRIVRYCRSGIALQRLVHVKMLAETAETVGCHATINTLIPLLAPLVKDPESVIRQHLASQLLPLSFVAMVRNVGFGQTHTVSEMLANLALEKVYDPEGYKLVTTVVIAHLNSLINDADVDVRRSASDSLAGLAFHVRKEDVGTFILPIPLRLAHQQTKGSKKVTAEQESFHEELRITAANLLAELGGAGEKGSIPSQLIGESILPTVLGLCGDPSFRVRRAAAQALPRVLGGATVEDARTKILPAFETLSKDEVYRVRKSTGECLVDMSRSLMILSSKEKDSNLVNALRRTSLIPIAENLLSDANKFVRHGMMQFLGPFLASFYPYVDSSLSDLLPGSSESDGSNHCGIVSQFFPHASSMVSRLNSSAAATSSAPTPILASTDTAGAQPSPAEEMQQVLPAFVKAGRLSSISLRAVVTHRQTNAPDADDLTAVMGKLLDQFVGLATVSTGDDNTDAEMRVYCAYSYPAVVLLLGPENWEGRLKQCFVTLLNPSYGSDGDNDGAVPPLPVKRCLGSSLHTLAHVLGPDITADDIMPIFIDHFLRDTDESVRLNMIRNFPTLISLLPLPTRSQYLLQWCETIRGEEVLGAMRRSATNPLVLNWRQRDYVSRSLSELMGMVDAVFAHTYLWPILKLLLTDTISLVREDAIWAIPMLLKAFCPENVVVDVEGDSEKASELWSGAACQEVVGWLKESILRQSASNTKKGGTSSKGANFSSRQLFCRVCATAALAIRFGEEGFDMKDQVSQLNAKLESMAISQEMPFPKQPVGPYQSLTSAEREHLKRILMNDLLPTALEFKDDRVTNVRLTLMKVLQMMPEEASQITAFSEAVQCLEEEVETWESFNGIQEVVPAVPVVSAKPVMVKGERTGAVKPVSTTVMTRDNGVAAQQGAEMGSYGSAEETFRDSMSEGTNKARTPEKIKRKSSKKKKGAHEHAQGHMEGVGQSEVSMASI